MNYIVMKKNGEPLNKGLYTFDENTRSFLTDEDDLVLDFSVSHAITFRTGSYCTFKTGNHCIFNTGSSCNFKTGDDCIFNVGSDCTFETGSNCLFKTGSDCIFETRNKCIVVRRDISEIIALVEGEKIKLNTYRVPGFKVIKEHTIVIDGKEIKISEESFNQLKESLI